MSIRLIKENKRDIARKARQISPINKQIDKLHEDRALLAERIRIASLGGKNKAHNYSVIADSFMKIRQDLPENLITHSIGINTSNHITVKYENNKHMHLRLNNVAVLPTNTYDIIGTDFAACLIDSLDQEELLRKQLQQIEDQVYASIAGITTLKKLLETWPEVVELLPQELKQPKPKLPALRVDNLNKLVGLPTSKTK